MATSALAERFDRTLHARNCEILPNSATLPQERVLPPGGVWRAGAQASFSLRLEISTKHAIKIDAESQSTPRLAQQRMQGQSGLVLTRMDLKRSASRFGSLRLSGMETIALSLSLSPFLPCLWFALLPFVP